MLTDTRIKNTKAGKRPQKLTDAGGLYVEVRPTGAKLWRYRYRIGGTENVYALGEYAKALERESDKEAEARRAGGRFTLSEARTERDRCRGLVKQGTHPAHDRKLATLQRRHDGSNTFEAIYREWLAQNSAHWTPETRKQRENLIKRPIFKTILPLPIRDVTSAQLLAILQYLVTEAPSFAVIAQQALGGAFRLAISTLRAKVDPLAPLKGAIKVPPTRHKTPLSPDGIAAFFKTLEAYPSFATRSALELLWLTLARTNELLQAEWSEFDLKAAVWKIPGERMKRRTVTAHFVPLPTQAVDILQRLKALTGDGALVFQNRRDPKRPPSETMLNKACTSMGYGGKFSPHAIRTTGSTMLNEMGYNGDWIERQLAHQDSNETRASYNGAKYLDQRRKMMQEWADYLQGLEAGAEVIPLRRARA